MTFSLLARLVVQCFHVLFVVCCFLCCAFLKEKKVAKVSEATKSLNKQTEEKLTAKMESTLRNRETQLNNLLDRLKEHVCDSAYVGERGKGGVSMS